jgi:hypothetical protein
MAEPTPLLSPDEIRVPGAAQQWRRRRAEIDSFWRDFLGPAPARLPWKPVLLSSEDCGDHTRELLADESDPEALAYLLLPRPTGGRAPGMLVLHQTTPETIRQPVGISGREAMHVARQLVQRGYACMVPRNFLWAPQVGDDYAGATARLLATPPWRTGMARMLWDAQRALDYLAGHAAVDPARLGCIGHSLGGKEALYVAAFDDRVRATVSCEGGIAIGFCNWTAPWYLGERAAADGFLRDHHELLGLVAPRSFLLVGGEGTDGEKSRPYVDAARPVYTLLGHPDRLALQLHAHGHDLPPPGPDRERWMTWLDEQLGGSR